MVGYAFDQVDDHLQTPYHETVYSLLDTLSPAYREAFGNALLQRLEALKREGQSWLSFFPVRGGCCWYTRLTYSLKLLHMVIAENASLILYLLFFLMIWNVYFYFQTTALPRFLSVLLCDFSMFISIVLIVLYTFLGRNILLYIQIIADFNYFCQ